MPEDEFIWQTEKIKLATIEWDVEREPELRCAQMVERAMREPGKTAAKGYLSAAQWFALASKETRCLRSAT